MIVGDELRFYYGAFSGKSPLLKAGQIGSFEQDNAMYAGASTGLVVLRRDGFASMDADETQKTLLTRPLLFSGNRLFVNVDTSGGEMRAEILEQNGKPIASFTYENCIPIRLDDTLTEVRWKGIRDISSVSGKAVRFRFSIVQGSLYSFWVSGDEDGASRGYVAAGGPGFTDQIDTVGRRRKH